MKKYFLVGLVLVFVNSMLGNPIDTTIAKQVGKTFFYSLNQVQNQKSISDIQLVYKGSSMQKSGEQQVFFYVYNIDNKGFVIVSADNKVVPILGYSKTNNFDPNNIPPALMQMLLSYGRAIENVITNNVAATIEITELWNELISGNTVMQKATTTSVSPLIQTKWGQSGNTYNSTFYELYNNLCPYDTPQAERTLTGCVATAMAQVMRYWKYPSVGMGSYSYVHSTYGTLSADFESVHYPYDSMPLQLSNLSTAYQINAIATLMYQCGVSVEMDYGVDGSSSSLVEWTTGARSGEYALKTNFGYYSAKSIEKDDYSSSQWISILKTELDAAQPVLYRGEGSGGGHAFICDGYDESGNFHFNWGWKGYCDGYFTLSALNPGGSDFTAGQTAIINIKPFNVEITPDTNNIIYVSSTGNGNKTGSSWANATPYLSLAMQHESNSPLKIWVKAGTYYGDTNMNTAFTVGAGNAVYGGFAGNEPADYNLLLRNFTNNNTILDGQATQQVLLLTQSSDSTTVCDGFTIRNGQTNGDYDYGAGVMIYDNTLLMNCIVENCLTSGAYAYGAGVYANGGKIINSIIRNNITVNSSGGGGLCLKTGTKTTLINSIVCNNYGKFGAGILAWGSGEFINTDIVNNTASSNGGGLYGNGSGETCLFTNCIIWGNKLNTSSNQIRFGATVATVNYTAIEGGYAGSNNISLEADNVGYEISKKYVRFINPSNGLYNLTDSSACIDAGNPNISCLGSVSVDLNNSSRIKRNYIDMGAYEYGCINTIAIQDNICEGNTYDLNGFSIPADTAGTFIYSRVLGSNNGCDSVLQLTLTVLPVSTYQFSIRMAGAYTWNDSVYSVNGTYQQTLIAANGCDSIVTLKYVNTTGIDNYTNSEKLVIYPNPANDKIILDNGNSIMKEAIVYDITGREIKRVSINETQITIDLSNLQIGMYVIKISTKQGMLTRKVQVVR